MSKDNISESDKFLIEKGIIPSPVEDVDVSFGDEMIDFGRTFVGQGALLGFGDELEAKIQTLFQSRPYEVILAEIRKDLKSFEERNPGTAITAEILGSIAPTALMVMSGVGAPSAAANTARVGSKMLSMSQKFKAAAPIAMGESAIYEVGKGEEGIAEDIYRAPEGAAWGLAGTGIATPVLHGAQVGLDKIMSAIRGKLGDKVSNVVIKQLNDLVKETGKSVGEIITDIQAGRLFAENKTLAHAISTIFGEGGPVKKFLTDKTAERAIDTRSDLRGVMKGSVLGDSADVDSSYATYMKGQGDVQEGSSDAYKQAFKGSSDLPLDMIEALMEALRRVPTGQDVIETINKAKGNVVPYFKFDESGRLFMNRKPTLEDAEEVYKAIRDHKTGVQVADNLLSDVARGLKAKLNRLSPQLQEARVSYQILKTNEEAFKVGTGALTKNAAEIKYHFDILMAESKDLDKEKARIGTEKLKAFRTGVMNAIENKLTMGGGSSAIAGDADMKLPAIIRTVFPGQDIESIMRKADIAETAQTMKNKVTAGGTGGGSDTFGRGASQTRREARGIAQGDSATRVLIQRALDYAIDKIAPKLDDKGRMEVAKILYSKDPDFVEKALTGDSPNAKIQQMVNDAITSMGYFGMPGAIATQPSEGVMDQLGISQ
jgi:hypothetical protein